MYSKSSSTSFLGKNGRADGRKSLLFGALRIVFGLHLSICGVSDLPILGLNLVKTGVQGVIFDNSSSAACHIAKIMNFGQFGKKNKYF